MWKYGKKVPEKDAKAQISGICPSKYMGPKHTGEFTRRCYDT